MAIKKRKRDPTTQISGPSIADLPMTIFSEILLKLSTKSIVLCKCVCKTWHGLISDPQFAKLHFAQSKTCPLIRDRQQSRISRALYLLEPEDGRDFDVGYCWCESYETESNTCCRIIKAKSKLKIPLRNAQAMLSRVDGDPDVVFGTKGRCKRKDFVKLKSKADDHIYRSISSCNGLLCLAEKSCPNSVVVCNPITGEFMYLPKPRNNGKNDLSFIVGLGFSPKISQYKVLRIFYTDCLSKGYGIKTADIHTLGADTWRKVDISTFKLKFIHSPTYFEGALHWFCSDNSKYSHCITSFELDEERFRSHSAPPPLCQKKTGCYLDTGVLGGRFCVYDDYSNYGRLMDIWVMNEYGTVGESWTKLFSIDISKEPRASFRPRYQPISYLNNGALLMFDNRKNKLIYYDQSGGLRFKHLRSRVITSEFKAIAHTPSFISLKDIAIASNVEVFNVNSRCGKIKLLEEAYSVSLECGRRS